ncbi:MAG: DUF2911 domain-containing protein [Saprospiraceae bacterium]
MKKLIILSLIILNIGIVNSSQAQIEYPAPSPPSKMIQTVGLTEIQVEYSRPSLKGRKMFGGLLPYGELWRTGANACTKITVNDDVEIQGNDLPKGTYALYTIPNRDEWTIIFHKNTTHWGTGGKNYDSKEDAFRFTVKPTFTSEKVETFTIDINNIRSQTASIDLLWDNAKISFNITVDTDSKVMADIKKKMKGISGTTYYQAARYYHEEKKDFDLALEWIEKAIDIEGDKYWLLRLKSLILADLGKTKKAIKVAKKSKKLAQEDGNENYVKLNETSIKEWKK